jgi:hypothetical protein
MECIRTGKLKGKKSLEGEILIPMLWETIALQPYPRHTVILFADGAFNQREWGEDGSGIAASLVHLPCAHTYKHALHPVLRSCFSSP